MANVCVNFKVLQERHPTGTEVRGLVKGIPSYVNESIKLRGVFFWEVTSEFGF